MVSRFDYAVLPASSPLEALELALDFSRPIVVMLTDIDMPSMNGFELAREVRNYRPNLKVIFMSGNYHSTDAGEDVFLQKPFTLEQLAKAIHD